MSLVTEHDQLPTRLAGHTIIGRTKRHLVDIGEAGYLSWFQRNFTKFDKFWQIDLRQQHLQIEERCETSTPMQYFTVKGKVLFSVENALILVEEGNSVEADLEIPVKNRLDELSALLPPEDYRHLERQSRLAVTDIFLASAYKLLALSIVVEPPEGYKSAVKNVFDEHMRGEGQSAVSDRARLALTNPVEERELAILMGNNELAKALGDVMNSRHEALLQEYEIIRKAMNDGILDEGTLDAFKEKILNFNLINGPKEEVKKIEHKKNIR
ncbi:MAG: hypothetical protein AAF666_08590 [Pseudomonadota bacterium]